MPLYCSQGHKNDSNHRFCNLCGQRLPLGVGHVLDKRYRIVSQLGQGGFGRTYLAEALHRFGERCVLKEFAPQVQGAAELHKAQELFQREAGVLHQLQHPQLPKFWELFPADMGGGTGCLFLVQDYVEGQTYFDVFQSGKRLSEKEAIELLCQMLSVLSYIHAKGVIHRDISPDNIILRKSDQRPVLIDFGCVKEIAATAVSNFTNLGEIQTRLGKKGYAPEEQLRQGKVHISSDLYSLGVTALVLMTGKEPQHLYDIYTGSWRWGQEIKVSSQLQAVLQKMVAYRPSDRYSTANEALQALQSQVPHASAAPTPTNPNPTQITAIASNHTAKASVPLNPNPAPIQSPRSAFISRIQTLVFAPKAPPKLAQATPSPITPPANTQVVQKPPQFPTWLSGGLLKVGLGAGLVIITTYAGWAVMSSMIRSVHLPVVKRASEPISNPSPSSAEQRRIAKLLSRRQDLSIPDAYFNTLVNDLFYKTHPEMQGQALTLKPEDAALRNAWYDTAEDLLDKLEQAQLSATARRQLGRYTQQDYQTWQRQAKQENKSGYTIDHLTEQTDKTFYQLFPEQRGEKLNLKTFGQIWYAIFFEQVSQLETGKNL